MLRGLEDLDELIRGSREILDRAIEFAAADKGPHEVVAIVILFSGGNDSTTLAHLFRDRATHAAHANTGIGIEQTRQFVRDTCKSWGLPLIEEHPEPGQGYRELVLGEVRNRGGTGVWRGGFPGPGAHNLMYQRLKERALHKVRRQLVSDGRKERVVFLAGRRREESSRRAQAFAGAGHQVIERDRSVVWASPLIDWTKPDLNAYRRRFPDVPRNEVADLLHMSGECLCGCFAHPGELDEIAEWFPEVAAGIRALEAEAEARGIARCRWGQSRGEKPSAPGRLCSSCDGQVPAVRCGGLMKTGQRGVKVPRAGLSRTPGLHKTTRPASSRESKDG